MEQFLNELALPTLLPLLVVSLAVFLILLLLKRAKLSWEKRYREPFHQQLLRPAGWGCIKRREDALFDIAAITVGLLALWGCLAMLVIYTKQQSFISAGLAGILFSVFLILHLRRRVREARTAYLGFLGEWSVAETLEPLAHEGWRVFHDFVITDRDKPFNIDHIAVGPTGVFAIETKARSKQAADNFGNNEAQVDFDRVNFTDGRRLCPMKQANSNAATLRDWLQSKGVEIPFVEPVVVLPGWTVKYKTSRASRKIRDPRNLVAYITGHDNQIDSAIIRQASEEIDKHCRSLKFSDVGF